MNRRVITVKFKPTDSGGYSYLTHDVKIKSGDTVVVESRGSLGLAVVDKTYGLSQHHKDKAHSWIIQKVDLDTHQALIEAESRRDFLQSEMEALLEVENKLDRFKEVAKTNPQMKKLLEQMESVTNNPLLAVEQATEETEKV